MQASRPQAREGTCRARPGCSAQTQPKQTVAGLGPVAVLKPSSEIGDKLRKYDISNTKHHAPQKRGRALEVSLSANGSDISLIVFAAKRVLLAWWCSR